MKRNICIVLILLSCTLSSARAQTTDIPETTESTTFKIPFYYCPRFEGTEVDLKGLSGLWFETARGYNLDKMECLNYTVPDSPTDKNMVELQLEYVDAANSKWDSVRKSTSLLWDDNAKNGIFTWNIEESSNRTSLPLSKVWTRNRHLTDEQKIFIHNKFNEMLNLQYLNYVEQSEEKCNNSAMRAARGAFLVLALALIAGARNI
ncbi:uncharacterized protein LOC6581143 isoform X2 [Drosophila mojavensis]|uniref:Lipocalin/cytosolic fatty-acid binding domain-containing protein n=1 Tax=Drosophila mojavensis TaxID=7230 RepID=B4KMI2_DROMO|nr:uncharacterized protein LOC6581143 isoform X2 [Drosophila mojavensis]EDW10829.2 uncharacterized protein Dmoj_GI21318 [Drosophila mojavensis]